MIESNGKHGDGLVHISEDVQRLLEKGKERRLVEGDIDDKLIDVINALGDAHPMHIGLIADKLEGYANKLRAALEAEKRKERQGGNKR